MAWQRLSSLVSEAMERSVVEVCSALCTPLRTLVTAQFRVWSKLLIYFLPSLRRVVIMWTEVITVVGVLFNLSYEPLIPYTLPQYVIGAVLIFVATCALEGEHSLLQL